MSTLIAGLVLFLGMHSISIVNVALRDRLVVRLGENAWKGLYTLVSLVGFYLIVRGYGEARLNPSVVYVPPGWLRHVALLLLVPVFPLLVSTYFPGRIKSAARHPTLLATKLWALAHLLANAMLADVVMFGAILIWAVADRISMKRRVARPLPGAPATKANDFIVLAIGLAAYAAFVLWLHAWLFGVSPTGI
jgi:uncharacterized membrane protein